MWIEALGAAALAGEPTFRGATLLDDGVPALEVKRRTVFGLTSATVSTLAGDEVVVAVLTAASPEVTLLSADFRSLGVRFGLQAGPWTVDAVLADWWRAGVLTAAGADPDALAAWCDARGCARTDPVPLPAEPAPSAATSLLPPPRPAPAPPPAPAAPRVISATLHVRCPTRVRLFLGSTPTSGGTFGWESPNTVRSVSVREGSVVCVADDRDRPVSCWTAAPISRRLEVDCASIGAW